MGERSEDLIGSDILARFGGNAKIFQMALGHFLPEATRLLDQLTVAIDTQDANAALADLHTLKGVSSTIGAVAMAQIAATLEETEKHSQGLHIAMSDIQALRQLAISSNQALQALADSSA